jgi:UDP-glucose 4-epimerase
MKIFLTGGAGYIGSTATRLLLEEGHHVTVFDSLVSGHRAAVPNAAAFVQGDLAQRESVIDALSAGEYDAVMHFAAFIEAGESMRDPGKYFRNNVVNSQTLLDACIEVGVERFVLSSTAAVYASSDGPLSEASLLGPSNVYGETKLIIERMLKWYADIHGIRYASLRYFNAAGAIPGCGEAHHPESHLIPLVLQVPLGQRYQVSIFGTDYPTPDGTCIRDYIHVADLVAAHHLALMKLDQVGSLVYNLGNGSGYSVREVIETARSVTGHPIPAMEIDRRPGDAPHLVASSEKIRTELGWTPRYPSLSEIIASAWEWHRSHPSGYD